MKKFPKELLTKSEKKIFEKLKNPDLIQKFLNTLPYNEKDTVRSVRQILKAKKAHCLEGAILASAILWYHGEKPFLFDLRTTKDDQDHVVALFQKDGFYGAISATSHSVLRYRDPVHKNLRELALTYFHEYFLNSGEKTLRAFSKKPFSLLSYGNEWLFGDDELYEIGADLDDAPHEIIAPNKTIRNLRKADKISIRASDIV